MDVFPLDNMDGSDKKMKKRARNKKREGTEPYVHAETTEDLLQSNEDGDGSNMDDNHDKQNKKTKRRGRGVAKGLGKLSEEEKHMQFDSNHAPTGKKANRFGTWLGLSVRSVFPDYCVKSCEIPKEQWDNFWLLVQDYWYLNEDGGLKNAILRQAKKLRTDFICHALWSPYRDYKEINVHKYSFLDASKWSVFVKLKSSPTAKADSYKAAKAAYANTNHHRTGRDGYKFLRAELEKMWGPIKEASEPAKKLSDYRARVWLASRIKNDRKTGKPNVKEYDDIIKSLVVAEEKLKEAGIYGMGKEDPLTQTIGPEHGGRTRAVSSVIGYTQVKGPYFKNARSQPTDPGFPSSGCASGSSHTAHPDIQTVSPCDLLWPYGGMDHLVLAKGQVWPNSERFIDNFEIGDDCVKVQVEYVEPGSLNTPAPCNQGQLCDLMFKFIAWPRKAIKVHGASTVEPYYPEMLHTGEVPDDHQGTYSYLQGDDFLFDDDPLSNIMGYQDQKTHLDMSPPPRVEQKVDVHVESQKDDAPKLSGFDKEQEEVESQVNALSCMSMWHKDVARLLRLKFNNDWISPMEIRVPEAMFGGSTGNSCFTKRCVVIVQTCVA